MSNTVFEMKLFFTLAQISNIDIKVLHLVESLILKVRVFETGNILHVITCEVPHVHAAFLAGNRIVSVFSAGNRMSYGVFEN